MELRHLRYFVAVAERLNFTAAAHHLGIAQPPLSVQIQKLEAELGSPLFLRQNRRVDLTPAGHRLLVDANDILERADQAVSRIQDEAAGRVGSLVIACSEGAFSEAVTKRLRKFLRKHRGIRLDPKCVENGSGGDVDGLISDFTPNELPAGAIALARSGIEVAVPPKHRLSDRSSIAPADLIGETLLVSPFDLRSAAERVALQQIEAAGAQVSLEIRAGPLQQRFWRVSLGIGIAFCSAGDRGSLDARRVPLADSTIEVVTALIPNPASRSAALPLLIEAIRA